MKLLFVRHGQTNWNSEGKIQGSLDIELNDIGITQAKELSNRVLDENYKFSRIYSSIQRRALKTSEILSSATNIELIPIKGIEEINLGEWEGLTWSEVEKKYPVEYSNWYKNRRYTNPPNGESYQVMLERVLASIKMIINDNIDDVVIVTHSAVIMCLQCYIFQTPFEEMMKYKTDNTTITAVDSELLLQ